MKRSERAIEAQLAGFRESIETYSAAGPYEAPLEPLWIRAAAGVGGFVLYILGLALVCGLLGVMGAAVRLGWEWAG